MDEQPPIQLIANLVVHNGDAVLLARYDASDESDPDEGDIRWWLPGQELEPYEHPDEAARRALAAIPGLVAEEVALAGVQSFRGRRGWHVSFDYRVTATGDPGADGVPAGWFSRHELPRTMHGRWERDVIDRLLG
jgi:ADP-ribose pyrophosphatase YjhB (NUDIX family)